MVFNKIFSNEGVTRWGTEFSSPGELYGYNRDDFLIERYHGVGGMFLEREYGEIADFLKTEFFGE